MKNLKLFDYKHFSENLHLNIQIVFKVKNQISNERNMRPKTIVMTHARTTAHVMLRDFR